MTLVDFICDPKSLLVAPAGHGKTHAIAECISLCPEDQCQLILTHTHAGIASIKTKMDKLKIPTKKYHIETISSFAQRFVMAYCNRVDLPEQYDNEYFNIIIGKAIKLFSLTHILDVVKNTYDGLIVDEYQDCDIKQHEFIMKLARVLPTHLLGDEMQGIFSFAGRIVRFDEQLADFNKYNLLSTPWRWKAEGFQNLGFKILEYRQKLESSNKTILLTTDTKAHVFVAESVYELNDINKTYFELLRKIIFRFDCDSILIITPSYFDKKGVLKGSADYRAKIRKMFDYENRFQLLEAIDSKECYSNARAIDKIIEKIHHAKKKEKKLYDLLRGLSFNKKELELWFDVNGNKSRIIEKRGEKKELSTKLLSISNSIISRPSKANMYELISFFLKEVKLKPKRPELVSSIIYCLRNNTDEETTVFHSMLEMKNRIRRHGRKIQGRCIGTTLLTKGLEFDTVIILDAHRFEDSKNFYVAISRACKNLVIITKNRTLTFDR